MSCGGVLSLVVTVCFFGFGGVCCGIYKRLFREAY